MASVYKAVRKNSVDCLSANFLINPFNEIMKNIKVMVGFADISLRYIFPGMAFALQKEMINGS